MERDVELEKGLELARGIELEKASSSGEVDASAGGNVATKDNEAKDVSNDPVETMHLLSSEGEEKEVENPSGDVEPQPVDLVPVEVNTEISVAAFRTTAAVAARVVEPIKQSNLNITARASVGNISEEPLNASEGSTGAESTFESDDVVILVLKSTADLRGAVKCCERVKEVIKETIDTLENQVAEFMAKRVEDDSENATYTQLIRKYGDFISLLRNKRTEIVAVSNRAELTATNADKDAAALAAVTDDQNEYERVKHRALEAKDNVDKSCIVVYRAEHCALRSLRRIWYDIRDGANLAENAVDDSDGENPECHPNRGRKSLIAHAIAFAIGVVFLVADLLLFKIGSDSFIAIMVLAVITLGYSVIYWSFRLYEWVVMCRTKEFNYNIDEPQEFLDVVEERINYLEEYLREKNESPAPSDSEEGR